MSCADPARAESWTLSELFGADDRAGGELIFHVFAAVAQMERRLIAERTRAGLAAARARGRVGAAAWSRCPS